LFVVEVKKGEINKPELAYKFLQKVEKMVFLPSTVPAVWWRMTRPPSSWTTLWYRSAATIAFA